MRYAINTNNKRFQAIPLRFKPYGEFSDVVSSYGVADDEGTDTEGFYIGSDKSEVLITTVLKYTVAGVDFGLCDNASDILNRFAPVFGESDPRKIVVLMTPLLNDGSNDAECDLCKYGDYIGKQDVSKKRLCDNPSVKLVFYYRIYEVSEEV